MQRHLPSWHFLKRMTRQTRTFIIGIMLMLLCAFQASAHTWEIRVKQNQDGTLTWYGQSYHAVSSCGLTSSGIRINGVSYNWTAEFNGSVLSQNATVFTVSPSQTNRASYATVTTPYIAGTLNVVAYSTNQCWALMSDMPPGNGSFNPPPPPVCTTCPLTGWTNTVAAAGNNNTTLCNPTDDVTTATIKVSHLACANITGDKQFSVVFDPGGANVSYGPFSYAAGVETSVTINVPYGTTSSTQVNVIDADFPCNISHGLTLAGNSYLGERETTPPTITCPGAQTIASCETVIPNYTTNGIVADNCTPANGITVTQSPAAGTAIASGSTVTVTLTAKDAAGNTAQCSFTVNRPNITPVAVNDAAVVCAGSAVTFNVLGNDTHPQGAALTINEFTQPSVGTVVKNADNTFTYTAPAGYTGPVTFTYVNKANDGTQAFSGTGHFYEYISSPGISWTAANAAANAKTFNGLKGYLGTFTSAAENTFATQKLQGSGWIGASDLGVEGVWRWVTGPEALIFSDGALGLHFSDQYKGGWCDASQAPGINGNFAAWAGGEPNDCGSYNQAGSTNPGRGGEHYAHFYSNGVWNDFPGSAGVDGYVVEYGGLESCLPQLTATGTVTITVNALPVVTIAANGPTTFCAGGSVTLDAGAYSSYAWSNGATSRTITVSTAGTYSVSVPGANGCVGTGSTVVTVNANPTPAITASATTICNGSSVTLSAPATNVTRTYTIALSNLVNLPYNCGSGSYYGNSQPGFSWTDNGTIAPTNVKVQFSIGVNCNSGVNRSTSLNGVAGADFTPTSNCSCNSSSQLFTSNFGATGYNVGGVNTFTIGNLNSWIGFVPSGSLNNSYAIVTVTYAEASGTYSWNPGGSTANSITVTPSANTTYTLTQTNATGCSASTSQLITVNATPTAAISTSGSLAICPGATSVLTANATAGSGSIAGYTWLRNGSPIAGATGTTYAAASTGAYAVRITNSNGCSTVSAPVTVTVSDNAPPVPTLASLPTVSGECSAAVTVAPTATDNCTGTITGVTNDATSYSAQGTYTIHWRFSDGNGNTSYQDQTVIVKDETAPVAPVLADVTDECAASISVPTATDNCAGTITGTTSDPLSYSAQGTHVITWSFNDGNGNVTTATQKVIIRDITPPAITCAPSVTVSNDANACGAIVNYAAPIATDNCSAGTGAPVNFTVEASCNDGSFEINTELATNVTSISFGGYGYQGNVHGHGLNLTTTIELYNPSTNKWILVQSNTGDEYYYDNKTFTFPSISQVSKIRFAADQYVGCAYHISQLPGTLNSGASGPTVVQTDGLPSGSQFPVGTTVNTFKATDASGNTSTCSFSVTVDDTQFPVLVGVPESKTVECSAVPVAAIVSATDNCTFSGIVTYNEVRTDGSCPSAYTLTRTWSTTDKAGNTTTASQVITVQDTKAPMLTVPANVAVNNDKGICGAAVTYSGSATDNCDAPVITYSHSSGSIFPVGTTTVKVTATDACGNATSGTFTITVTDNEAPGITAPAAIAKNNDATHCYATVSLGTPVTADNCKVEFVSNDAPAIFPVGTTTVTWTVVDIHGNSNTATQVVTVTDNEKPLLTCVANQSKVVDHAVCAYEVKAAEFNATATDNCGVQSLTYTITGATSGNGTSLAGVLFNKGTSTVTWTAVDIHGNVSTCSYTVTVSTSLAVTVANNSVLPQGVNANTIYTGYTPASVLKLTAAPTGGGAGYAYQWSVPAGFSLVNGSATQQTVQITSTIAGDYSGVVTLTVTDVFGCTTTTNKTIQVKDVRCGNKNDKVLVCHNTGSAKNPWVQVCIAPSAVATHLANGGYLGTCNIATVTSNGETKPAIKAKAATVLAYPNPSRGNVSLRLSNFTTGKVTIQVIDGNGKLVSIQSSSIAYTTEDVSIDLSRVAGGVYQIKVIGDKEMLMTKVVIAR
jgi:hypothetical protein